MAYLDHIRACNRHSPDRFVPFIVAGQRVGAVRRDLVRLLAEAPQVFETGDDAVWLSDGLATPAERSDAVAQVCATLAERHGTPRLRGEAYAVAARWGDAAVMEIDRALVSLLGIRAYGVHVNGIIAGNTSRLWIATRAADKAVAPGKLDNLIAGGQPAGLGLMDNLVKEAAEEADIPEALARTARPVGAVSYCHEDAWGLKPDTMFCYDLVVPADFVPRNTDGEIAFFQPMDVDAVAARVRDGDDFKFNVNLVLIDFLLRHGHLSPDSEPDYVELVQGLRRDVAQP